MDNLLAVDRRCRGRHLLLHDAFWLLTHRSPRFIIEKLGRLIVGRFYSDRTVIVMCTVLAADNSGSPAGDLVIKQMGEQDLDALHALNRRRGLSRATPRLAGCLDHGHSGIVAYEGESAIAYMWYLDHHGAPAHIAGSGYSDALSIPAGDAYFYDLYVERGRRRSKVGSTVLSYAESRLAERGIKRLWLCVDDDNVPARGLYTAHGYTSVRAVTFSRRFRHWSTTIEEIADPPSVSGPRGRTARRELS